MSDQDESASGLDESQRRARAAERRSRATLIKSQLGLPEHDFTPTRGPEALALVTALTREAWSLAGRTVPGYSRAETPYRFVPASRT